MNLLTFLKRVVVVFGLFLVPNAYATVVTALHVTAITLITNGAGNRQVFFELHPSGTVEVTPYAPDVVRVRFHFGGLYEREEIAINKPFNDWPPFTQTFSQPNATNYLIQTDALRISIVLSNRFQVHFLDPSGYPVLLDDRIEYNLDYKQIDDLAAYEQVGWAGSVSVSNFPSGFKLRSTKRLDPRDAFFGLGDTAGPLNRRGRAIQFWNQDTYAFGEEKTPRYTALPMMYGVRPAGTNHPALAYGLFFNNPARPVFNLNASTNTWLFEAGDDQLDYFFFGGGTNRTMPAVIDRYSELTGRPAVLPKWALGFHQSRHSYFSQDRVMEVATAMRANDFPGDAIYLDIGSQATVNGQNAQMTFNDAYTNVPGLVQATADLGIKLIPLIEPLLTTNDPLYATARDELYFLKNNDLSTYVGTNFLGRISWLDFSIVPAADWWRGLLTNYLGTYGFEGIWNDLNEPNENAMPLNILWFLDGRYGGGLEVSDTRKWHAINKNTYSIWECRVTYEALRMQHPHKRPFVLSRSAWPGIQQYAAGWGGDNISNFDHLRFNTPFGLNVMISGQAWFGHDIGGFVDNSNNELIARWTQIGALQPMFRNHTTLDTADQEPWVFDEDYVASNRRWTKFRYQLMPYLYSQAAASTTNGIPLNAPTVFYFQADTNTYSLNDYDFMVGRDLLAAPVYLSGASTREVYLPAGPAWYHWDTGRRFAGGQTVVVPASLAYMPLFSRAGAIIPMGPVQYYANQFQPASLDLHHWPGGANRVELYEDDGETTNYLAGVVARTPLEAVSTSNSLTFTSRARVGSYHPGARDFYLIVYDLDPVTAVRMNSNSVTRLANREELEQSGQAGWSYSFLDRRLTVKFPGDGAHRVVQADFAPPVTYTTPSFSTLYTNLAVAGTFNFWNQRAANLRKVGPNQWAGVFDLTGWTNIQFKFVANDAWEVANWGDDNPISIVPPLLNRTGTLNGANIQLSGSYQGFYTFTFNETNQRFGVVSAWNSDVDGDGLPDAWEAYYGLNPYATNDAVWDIDGDGFDNRQEFIAGTSIVDPASFLQLAGIVEPPSLSWLAVSGRRYRVQYSTNLLNGLGWLPLVPHTNVSGTGFISITDTSTAPYRVYRLEAFRP
ncbi:MAG TPA: glycoside hydrolase family 31 protein [Kiritimatiellia bacterium]|nr:glycoside hydrolase family 31 protein [Kiritimatiellia bacterium]HMO98766.1 glycoside hydrolase family 31 protein [Kiritimatiellia bacterium]HMP95942.1 glycoside hydrolase family 31 protein [Kiritimatiellia bacterium]